MSTNLRIVDQPAPEPDAADADGAEPAPTEIDATDLEESLGPSAYAEASEPDWDEFRRDLGAFLCELLPEVGKAAFVDGSVHHFAQLEQLRLVDDLETDETDDVVLAALSVGLAPSLLARTASAQSSSVDADCDWLGDQDAQGNSLFKLGATTWDAVDVRTISSATVTETRYHDGSGSNTEGPAIYRSTDEWISIVDGSVIS